MPRRALVAAAGLLVVGAVLLTAERRGDGDGEATDPPIADSTDSQTAATTTHDLGQEASTSVPPSEAGDAEASDVPVTVAIRHEERLELHTPGHAPRILVDDLKSRSVQAVSPAGEVLLSGTDQWFDLGEIVAADGRVTAVDFGGQVAVLNDRPTADGTVVEILITPDDDGLGDLAEVDLATGEFEIVRPNTVFLSQNLLPTARAGGVVVEEYTWIAEYEVLVTGPTGETLPSPTDGRFGVGFGLRRHCPGAARSMIDTMGPPVLDDDGARLAWRSVVQPSVAPDGNDEVPIERATLHILALSDAAVGAVEVDPVLGALVALRGTWAVFERGFVDVSTGLARSLEPGGMIVAAPTLGVSKSAPMPPGPLPAPACSDGAVSIYGLRDLVVGAAPPPGVLAGAWEREPRCWLVSSETGEIAVHLDERDEVLGVVVADFLEATPSGIRRGTPAAEVIARLGERIEAVASGIDAASATALDFVPADPAEADLGLRFVLNDGRVSEMWAGDRDFTRSAASCLTS